MWTQAPERTVFYSFQNSECKISIAPVLSYRWLQISFPCYAFPVCLVKTCLAGNILISEESAAGSLHPQMCCLKCILLFCE